MFAGTVTSWTINSPQELAVILFALVSFSIEYKAPAALHLGIYFSCRCEQERVNM